jgi:hypothetical protein
MGALRLFLRDHRRLAVLLLGFALAMKALMPAGYMVGAQGKVLTISICADAQGGGYSKQIVVPYSGKHSEEPPHVKDGQACPFSALTMAALGGVDPVLLALALAFVLALGFATAPPLRLVQAFHLRPPLRGPPANA